MLRKTQQVNGRVRAFNSIARALILSPSILRSALIHSTNTELLLCSRRCSTYTGGPEVRK